MGTNLGEARSSGHMRLIDEEMGPTHPESLPPWLEAVDKIKYEISRVEKESIFPASSSFSLLQCSVLPFAFPLPILPLFSCYSYTLFSVLLFAFTSSLPLCLSFPRFSLIFTLSTFFYSISSGLSPATVASFFPNTTIL